MNETKPAPVKQDIKQMDALKVKTKQGIANSRMMARTKQTAPLGSSARRGKPMIGGGGCGGG